MSKMNLPNKLTLFRLFMVPFCVAAILIPESVLRADIASVVALVLFVAAAVTDALDGKIARKYHLITDFGKFMDPLADKFMVIGAMMAVVYKNDCIRPWFFWVMFAVVFRELAITSLRLILVSSEAHLVVAADILGKIKTVCQMVCVCAVLIEPTIIGLFDNVPEWMTTYPPLSFVFSMLTVLFTVWSGVDYFVKYGKYLDADKK